MRTSFAPFGHQARSLQGLLHPAVAESDAFSFAQLLMKVAHIEIRILVSVQRQHLFHCLHCHPMVAALATPLIEQSVIAMLQVPRPQPLHVSNAHARDLGRLDPAQLFGQRFQYHVLQFHHPLHFSGGQR